MSLDTFIAWAIVAAVVTCAMLAAYHLGRASVYAEMDPEDYTTCDDCRMNEIIEKYNGECD